jgi:steroid 5-alpha reductase family enzyme
MYIRPLIVGEVGHRKRERVSSDANDHLSLIHYRALVMLATQRANSPAAMMASMILMSLLLICISGCKGTNKCEKNQMLFEI